MQRLTGNVGRLVVPAATAAGAAYHGTQTKARFNTPAVVSPRQGNHLSDDDFEIVDRFETNTFTESEVSEAVHDLSRLVSRSSSRPIIEEVADEEDTSSATSSVDGALFNGEGSFAVDTSLVTVVSNLLNNTEVANAITEALINDPEYRRLSDRLGLPAAAHPLLIEGPPKPPPADDIFDKIGQKIEQALQAMTAFVRRLFRGEITVQQLLTNENGRPTVLLQVTVAVAAIVLTKRMVLKVA